MPRGVAKAKDGDVGKGDGKKVVGKRSRKMRGGDGGAFGKYCTLFIERNLPNFNNYKIYIKEKFKKIKEIIDANEKNKTKIFGFQTKRFKSDTRKEQEIIITDINLMINDSENNKYLFDQITPEKLISVLKYINEDFFLVDRKTTYEDNGINNDILQTLYKNLFFLKIYKLFEEFANISEKTEIRFDIQIATKKEDDIQQDREAVSSQSSIKRSDSEIELFQPNVQPNPNRGNIRLPKVLFPTNMQSSLQNTSTQSRGFDTEDIILQEPYKVEEKLSDTKKRGDMVLFPLATRHTTSPYTGRSENSFAFSEGRGYSPVKVNEEQKKDDVPSLLNEQKDVINGKKSSIDTNEIVKEKENEIWLKIEEEIDKIDITNIDKKIIELKELAEKDTGMTFNKKVHDMIQNLLSLVKVQVSDLLDIDDPSVGILSLITKIENFLFTIIQDKIELEIEKYIDSIRINYNEEPNFMEAIDLITEAGEKAIIFNKIYTKQLKIYLEFLKQQKELLHISSEKKQRTSPTKSSLIVQINNELKIRKETILDQVNKNNNINGGVYFNKYILIADTFFNKVIEKPIEFLKKVDTEEYDTKEEISAIEIELGFIWGDILNKEISLKKEIEHVPFSNNDMPTKTRKLIENIIKLTKSLKDICIQILKDIIKSKFIGGKSRGKSRKPPINKPAKQLTKKPIKEQIKNPKPNEPTNKLTKTPKQKEPKPTKTPKAKKPTKK